MSKQNVKASLLLLSAGSLVGQNIVQALGKRRSTVRLLAVNSVVEEPSLQDFDEVRLVPPTSNDIQSAHAQAVANWLEEQLPSLVIPCRDEDVAFLARFSEEHPYLAKNFLCGALRPAEIMLDKWQSWLMSCDYNLPFAPSVLPTDSDTLEEFSQKYGFPLIAKPRSGFASKDVTLISNLEQLINLVGTPDMMVQKYLGKSNDPDKYLLSVKNKGLPLFHSFESDKHSIQIMISQAGELCGIFTTLHKMRNGISVEVKEDKSEDAKKLGAQCAAVFSKLGWKGPVNIQCQRTLEGELSIYEFNGRFTGATAARALLGFDEVGIALQQFAGIHIDSPFVARATNVVRQPTSRAVPSALRVSLDTKGYWNR
ncbi:MAG: hypothetical protein ACKE9I_04820 [Methylophagaceae bacterium]